MISTLKPIADLARSLPADRGFALISNRRLYEIYALMLSARLTNQRLLKLAAKSSAASVVDLAGQEALLAAAIAGLQPGDKLVPGAGGLLACALKGLPPTALEAALGQHAKVAWKKHGLLPASLSFAEQLDQALDAGAEAELDGRKKLIVFICGDPAREEKLLKKAMKRAATEQLPVLFLANSLAGTPEFAEIAIKRGVPGMVVDGADALAIYRVVTESAAHARRGNGPTLIEGRVWPLAEGPTDPVKTIEAALKRRGIFSAQLRADTQAALKRALSAS